MTAETLIIDDRPRTTAPDDGPAVTYVRLTGLEQHVREGVQRAEVAAYFEPLDQAMQGRATASVEAGVALHPEHSPEAYKHLRGQLDWEALRFEEARAREARALAEQEAAESALRAEPEGITRAGRAWLYTGLGVVTAAATVAAGAILAPGFDLAVTGTWLRGAHFEPRLALVVSTLLALLIAALVTGGSTLVAVATSGRPSRLGKASLLVLEVGIAGAFFLYRADGGHMGPASLGHGLFEAVVILLHSAIVLISCAAFGDRLAQARAYREAEARARRARELAELEGQRATAAEQRWRAAVLRFAELEATPHRLEINGALARATVHETFLVEVSHNASKAEAPED